MFQDMKESASNIFRYGGEGCQCFRILWKVQLMFHDMVENAANVLGCQYLRI